LKQDLARRYRHDNIGYMRGKDPFIHGVLDDARRWYVRAVKERGGKV
jgi:GrpB-like predicted nucleotidyltransferase (UPF0157 family)